MAESTAPARSRSPQRGEHNGSGSQTQSSWGEQSSWRDWGAKEWSSQWNGSNGNGQWQDGASWKSHGDQKQWSTNDKWEERQRSADTARVWPKSSIAGEDRWSSAGWAKQFSKAKGKLEGLAAGSLVAVVTFQGSFCPVTQGHLACLVEARELLLGRRYRDAAWAPEGLETFAEVIGFMGCNTDKHVSRKLAPLPSIALEDREALIDLANAEQDWLCAHRKVWKAVDELRGMYPDLKVKHYVIDGADAAIWTHPWRTVSDETRSILVGRPPSADGKEDGTATLQRSMEAEGLKFVSSPTCILWPELSEASATKARRALREEDDATLAKLLHPGIVEWNRREGPYRRDADAGALL